MIATKVREEVLPGEAFLAELEATRARFLNGQLFRVREHDHTMEQLANAKRESYRGGMGGHRRDGERYLSCTPVKEVRRRYLLTLVDEAGQSVFGGNLPAHDEMDRWEAYEFGVTPEEARSWGSLRRPPSIVRTACESPR